MSDATPKSVSRFEANLLRITRFFLKQAPAEQAMRLIHESVARPACLSASAVELVKDSLAKGCVLYLVRSGGWKRERFLRGRDVRFGRLWERTPPAELALEFSAQALDFLVWLTANRAKDERPFWPGVEARLTPADRLLVYLAYEAMRGDAELAVVMRAAPVFTDNALIWLMYPNDFAGDANLRVPSFAPWFTGLGSLILEALQPILEQRWLDNERHKGEVGDWALLGQQGAVQGRIAEAFTEEANNAGRRELARFLVVVICRVLASGDMTPAFWTGGLQGAGPSRLAERIQIQRQALNVLRSAGRLRTWELSARRSGYLDDDYAVSKFWLSEWDRFDFGTFAARAERVLQQVEPLRME